MTLSQITPSKAYETFLDAVSRIPCLHRRNVHPNASKAKDSLNKGDHEGMVYYGNLLLSCPDAPISHQAGANIIIASGPGEVDPVIAVGCCKKALEIVEELKERPQTQHVSGRDVAQMREDAEVILAAVELLGFMTTDEAAKSWGSLSGGTK